LNLEGGVGNTDRNEEKLTGIAMAREGRGKKKSEGVG